MCAAKTKNKNRDAENNIVATCLYFYVVVGIGNLWDDVVVGVL